MEIKSETPCNCSIDDSRVINTRKHEDNSTYDWIPEGICWRKRQCKKCNAIFYTIEGKIADITKHFNLTSEDYSHVQHKRDWQTILNEEQPKKPKLKGRRRYGGDD